MTENGFYLICTISNVTISDHLSTIDAIPVGYVEFVVIIWFLYLRQPMESMNLAVGIAFLSAFNLSLLRTSVYRSAC